MSEPVQPKQKPSVATTGALRVVVLYAGFSALWILLSDRAVEALIHDPAIMTRASIAKGWVFVAVTATMLFVMVKRQVAKVASREAKLQALIHAIPDLVWLKNAEGIYLHCNPAFERFFGAKESEIIGKTDYDFVSRDQADFFRRMDQEAIKAGGVRENDEWITLTETGETVLVQAHKTPVRDATGELIGVLGIGRDITEHHRLLAEQARLQAQLHQAQKMELLGRFAGGVAHDFNNMLAVILANAELVLEMMSLDHPDRKRLEDIVRAARHSTGLTQQMLAFARKQPVNPSLLDLNEAVSGMLGVLERLVAPEIRLIWMPGKDLWKVWVDSTQLDQVLSNLVVNARDAITGPGQVELVTANQTRTKADQAILGDIAPGDYVCLSITDSGCGMTPELVAQIFEPFFTTKPSGKGTGLGLALVHGVVEQNQGSIQVESESGRGTCFRILFPRA